MAARPVGMERPIWDREPSASAATRTSGVIVESLAGKRIAITGATGFLGTALTERLLRCVPDCELVLVVRPGRRDAAARVQRDVLRNDAFDRLREQCDQPGADETYQEMTARRVEALALAT